MKGMDEGYGWRVWMKGMDEGYEWRVWMKYKEYEWGV